MFEIEHLFAFDHKDFPLCEFYALLSFFFFLFSCLIERRLFSDLSIKLLWVVCE